MTRQRLREGSIKWETQLSLSSFSQKMLKKVQHLSFKDKVKFVKVYVPEKVKIFIENNFRDEITFFQKKYLIKIEFLSEEKIILPEYKIELLNKSKKVINTVENIKKLHFENQPKIIEEKEKKTTKKLKKDTKKTKYKKKLRTLWVRRKKN